MADKSNGPRLKKDGTPFAKRGEGGTAAKRPAYLVYSIGEDGELVIHSATRKAEDVLAETAGQSVKKYAKFEI